MFKYVSFQFMNQKIEKYGYTYSFKTFVIQLIGFIFLVLLAGRLYLLKMTYQIILIICAVLMFPIIILSQFRYMYNNQRFENMINYMEKTIIFFKQEPKILTCMKNVMNYVDDKTSSLIKQSIHILHTDLSEQRYESALNIINEQYRSSRLVSLHRFMKTVEEKSSIDYRVSLNNLDYDLKEWVNRVYRYQSDLKVKKTQFMISLVSSVLLMAIFSVMWIEVNDLTHMIESPIYQIGSTLFLILSLLLFTFVQAKINGEWLVEDYKDDGHKDRKFVKYVSEFQYKKELKKQGIKILVFSILFFISLYLKNDYIVCFSFIAIIYFFYEPMRLYKAYKNKIKTILAIEFPLWLRDVALNLNNFVVLGALKHSYSCAHPVLQVFLDQLIIDIESNPASIEPYALFLKDFKINDITNCMLSLYSLQEVKHDFVQGEINDLIKRNQSMLMNSEKIRNSKALIGVLIFSFVPIFITMCKIFIDMMMMLMGIFAYMGG